MPVEVPICAKVVQDAPEQRSTRYWLMVPPVSVDAVHERLICTGPEAVAVRFVGAVGDEAKVVALAVLENALVFDEASVAWTR